MSARVPLNVLATIDPVLAASAAAGIVIDSSGAVAVRYETGGGMLRRTVFDVEGVHEQSDVTLEHLCLNCALSEDIVPSLLRLSAVRRWRSIVLVLPVGAEPAVAIRGLDPAVHGVRLASRLRIASVATVVDPVSLEDDLFGDDLLADRGLAFAQDDRRAVGEALARQIEYSDVVVTATQADQRRRLLLDHLRAKDSVRWDGLHEMDSRRLFGRLHDPRRAARRSDPRWVEPRSATGSGVWTLDLSTSRPLHPRRLMQLIPDLGLGRFRGRGRFWLPTRPGTVGEWDGAGHQVSVGNAGPWRGMQPSTRIVVTGIDGSPARLAAAFREAMLDDREMVAGLDHWDGEPDGFDLWLGPAATPDSVERY